MLCGPNPENSEKVTDNRFNEAFSWLPGFRDLFIPPRIVSDRLKLDLCTDRFQFKTSSDFYSRYIVDTSDNVKYQGVFHVIDKNLTDSMRSILKTEKFEPTEAEKKNLDRTALFNQPMFNMGVWWEKNVETQVQTQLEIFKSQYDSIAVKFVESQFKSGGNLLGIPLHSEVVANSVVNSSLQESRVYSLVLSEVFKKSIAAASLEKHLATNASVSAMKEYKKQNTAEEILKLQQWQFHSDLGALKAGTAPKLFKFQLINEEILSRLYWVMRNAEIKEGKDHEGKPNRHVDMKLTLKQVKDLEKSVEDDLKAMGEEIQKITELLPKVESGKKDEKPKPHRIIEFTQSQMSRVAKEILATISNIRFVSDHVENYAQKYKSTEELAEEEKRRAEREKQKKCPGGKSGAGTIGGKGC